MKKNPVETILGIFVLLVAAMFLFFSMKKINIRPEPGYVVEAVFTQTGGVQSGSDVRINGIKVGSVIGLDLTQDYTAKMLISIRHGISLPNDTVASITTDGLMGSTFVALEPGKSEVNLKDGDRIKKTIDFKSLETLIGEVIFSGDKK
ncbi:MAG: MlaD family protein [Alphaproteobacteria bacterium]|nr:MlaD family protein [Alphaproteobacteria bacterium]